MQNNKTLPPTNQALLKKVIDKLPQYFFWKDTQSVYLGCNENFAHLVGLKSSDDIIGKTDQQLPWQPHGDTADVFQKGDKDILEGQEIINQEEVLALPGGNSIPTLVSKSPVTDEQNHIIGIAGYFSDISRIKFLENELGRQYQQELDQQSKQSRLELATSLLHELNSPLETLRVVLEQQLRDAPTEWQLSRQAIKTITTVIKRLAIDADMQTPPKGYPALLSHLLNDCVAEKNLTLKKSEIAVAVNLQIDKSAMMSFVSLDQLQFYQVIHGLLDQMSHISRSTTQNHSINLSLKQRFNYALIEIRQEGNTDYMKKTGYGMAISTALKFAKQYNGLFDHQLKGDRGNRIRLQLPLTRPPENFTRQLILPPGAKVLVISKNDELFSRIKQRLGCYPEVRVEAFRKLGALRRYLGNTSYRYLTFIIDYELPDEERNGLELIHNLKLKKLAFLVTDQENDQSVNTDAEAMGISLIPQFLLDYIPIIFESRH